MRDADLTVIEEIRGGNPRRFALLVDRHKERAMTLALRLTGERVEAEELVQDAFLRSYQRLDQFRGDSRFGTWFYRILYNLCMTRLARRKGNVELLPLDDDAGLDALAAASEEVSALEQLEEGEMRTMLSDELNRLPERFKIPLTLFYVQEMSYEEIAAVTGLPLGTVKTNLFRGRNQLKKNVLARLHEEVMRS